MNLQPHEVVVAYYEGVSHGDLEKLREIMTPESYMMALSSFGLGLTLKDEAFKADFDTMEEDKTALLRAEERISKELANTSKEYTIEIQEIKPNGQKRTTVHYLENGKSKRLYFSLETDGWKINYLAGRKVDK